MKTAKVILYPILMLLWVGIQPALANSAPGPLVILPEITLLPLMILFTLLGGGYAILNHGGKRKFGVLKGVAAVLIIFFSGAHEGFGMMVCILFGFIAGTRGIILIGWGLDALFKKAKPEKLKHAAPARLIPAGTLLTVTTVFLVGMALAFYAVWPQRPDRIEKSLSGFVAFHLAYARIEKAESGRTLYDTQLTREAYEHLSFTRPGLPKNVQIEYGTDPGSFDICVPPQTVYDKFPFFPYNYLTSFPTYRADETGQIRMSQTRYRNQCCPEGAPVVMTVAEAEIQAAMDAILRQRQPGRLAGS